MLDMVERRSPAEGRDGRGARRALRPGGPRGAHRRRSDGRLPQGIDLYTKGQIDQAATQLAGLRRAAARFFPAAFFLGAMFASAAAIGTPPACGRLALGSEPRPAVVYTMVADARMRDGKAGSAIDILKPAYERDPAHDEIARRLAMAYLMTGRHADAHAPCSTATSRAIRPIRACCRRR